MSPSEVVHVLEEALLADPGSLREHHALGEIAAWDSMAVVAFVGEVSDRWKVDLSVDEVSACGTVGELVTRVRTRAGAV